MRLNEPTSQIISIKRIYKVHDDCMWFFYIILFGFKNLFIKNLYMFLLYVVIFVYLSHYSSCKMIEHKLSITNDHLKIKNQRLMSEHLSYNRLLALWSSGDKMNPISRLVYQLNLHHIAGPQGRIASR